MRMRSLRIPSLLAVVVAAGIAAGCGGGGDDETTTPANEPAGGGGGGGGGQIVEMTEYEFIPNDLTVKQGDAVTANNGGKLEHNLTIEEGSDAEKPSKELTGTPNVQPDDSAKLAVDVDPGEHSIVCTIPGHRELGMVGTIKVE